MLKILILPALTTVIFLQIVSAYCQDSGDMALQVSTFPETLLLKSGMAAKEVQQINSLQANPEANTGQAADITNRYAQTIIALSDPNTGMPPSHYGSPGYEDLAFTYDASVSAMMLKQAGKQAEAEKILDYFSQRLHIPLNEVRQNMDANGVYGILKLWGNSSLEFSAGEFKESMTPEALIKAMQTRGGIDVPIAQTPIQSLNKLLEDKFLYRVMPKQSDEARNFISRQEQGQSLSLLEIKLLNRSLIEKNYPLETPKRENGLVILNAIDLSSTQRQGRGQLEFLTTPGPLSFIIMAMLDVNENKYRNDALLLGNALLAMQRPDGGISDGDRSPGRVHVEPHSDALNVFYQLFQLTGDQKWKQAGDKAADWFMKNVYNPGLGEIYQGIWENGPSTIFATDCYSWTLAGTMGDRFALNDLDRLTQTMLSKSLVRITLELPGGKTQTLVSVDFTDANDPKVVRDRKGFHPMGSPEWTGGVILVLQKNAVRFWNASDKQKAGYYKAIAEFLTAEWLKAGYDVKGLKMFPYATGQGVAVGHGWDTPFFYIKGPNRVEGGSIVGGWPVLPINGKNPFIYKDHYFVTYQQIPVSTTTRETASGDLNKIVAGKTFREITPTQAPDARAQIVESGNFNKSAWDAFNRGDYRGAIAWATKVVNDPDWIRLARVEQRTKAEVIGGIIDYPWGTTYPNNDAPVHTAIWKYPLLNETAAAMWILATSNYELENSTQAKNWIRRIIKEVGLGQIADVVNNPQTGRKDLIDGYWSPIESWSLPSNPRDLGVAALYQEVLREKGIPDPMGTKLSDASLPLQANPPAMEQSSRPPTAPVQGAGQGSLLGIIMGAWVLMMIGGYFLAQFLGATFIVNQKPIKSAHF